MKHSQQPGDSSTIVKDAIDRTVEVAKARLTLNLFMALATVTVTGFAIQSRIPALFFLAATIPLVALFCDLLMRHRYTTIFLYQAASAELAAGKPEPTTLLFLDFRRAARSEYAKILRIEDPEERRLKFRKRYVFSRLPQRALIYGSAVVVEISLGFFARHVLTGNAF